MNTENENYADAVVREWLDAAKQNPREHQLHDFAVVIRRNKIEKQLPMAPMDDDSAERLVDRLANEALRAGILREAPKYE